MNTNNSFEKKIRGFTYAIDSWLIITAISDAIGIIITKDFTFIFSLTIRVMLIAAEIAYIFIVLPDISLPVNKNMRIYFCKSIPIVIPWFYMCSSLFWSDSINTIIRCTIISHCVLYVIRHIYGEVGKWKNVGK